MALQDILKKILEEAEVAAKEIEAQAAQDKKALAVASAAAEKEELAELGKKTEQALKAVDDKTAAMARQENAKSLARAKKSLIEQSLSAFLIHLEKLDDAEYEKVLHGLLKPLASETGTLTVPTDRKAITEKGAGKNHTIQTDDSVTGGFIFTSDTAEVDNTFANLVHSEFREALEMHFAQTLKLV